MAIPRVGGIVTKTRLSVVIPTWNAAELVAQAVDYLDGDGRPDWAEVIVVNDGSDDNTSAWIRTRYPNVAVIDHQTNRGFGAAVNTGFRAARGEYLVALNNDALVSWDCLSRVSMFLDTQPHASAGSPRIIDDDGQPQRVGFDLPQVPWRKLGKRWTNRQAMPGSVRSPDAPQQAEYLTGACVVFARRALLDVGLFDEQFHMFAEEIDLFHRLTSAGWTAWVLPDVEVTHIGGLTTRNNPDPRLAAWFRLLSYHSMCVYYRKHHPWLVAAVLRTALATRLVGRFVTSLVGFGGQWDEPREPREHLACLVTVFRPCRSTPVEPPLDPEASDG